MWIVDDDDVHQNFENDTKEAEIENKNLYTVIITIEHTNTTYNMKTVHGGKGFEIKGTLECLRGYFFLYFYIQKNRYWFPWKQLPKFNLHQVITFSPMWLKINRQLKVFTEQMILYCFVDIIFRREQIFFM